MPPQDLQSASSSFEQFLAEHAPQLRKSRGVFFTPTRVAAHIVARVDGVLQHELGLPLGLADNRRWNTLGLTPPKGVDPYSPFVRILDPAAGTGAFLHEVVRLCHRRMHAHWQEAGMDRATRHSAWQDYARQLLQRVHGFEVMEASHALCHSQLRALLQETGLQMFGGDVIDVRLVDAFAPETEELLARGITVVLANPPYARGSANKSDRTEALIAPYKDAVAGEKNLQPLSDDYIKFIGLFESLLSRVPAAVLGMITNNTWLSGHLHRGIRSHLLQTFPRIDLVDLHGSAKVASPTAERDENVFDIGQGVAITVARRFPDVGPPRVRHAALAGRRRYKLEQLGAEALPSETLPCTPPEVLFIRSEPVPPEYADFTPLDGLFSFHNVGGKPGEDGLLVALSADEVIPRLERRRQALERGEVDRPTEASRRLGRRPAGEPFDPARVVPYAYRPFDTRYTYADDAIWTRAVPALQARLDGQPVLLTTRIVKDAQFAHVFVTRTLPDVIFLSATSSVNCYAFPLSDLEPPEGHLPEQYFQYLYAVLHSARYRAHYGPALRRGFPRIPAAPAGPLYGELGALGARLIALHLGEAIPDAAAPRFVDGGDRVVRRVGESKRTLADPIAGTGTLRINGDSAFSGVSLRAWEHRVGGYSVAYNWLAMRKRVKHALSDADIEHFCTTLESLDETVRLMDDIDATIDAHDWDFV